MRLLSLSLALAVTACSTEPKLQDPGPDYGAEDAKTDSATRPASIVMLAFGTIQTALFTRTAAWRGFGFNGASGQKVTLAVDGLRDLDTVLYLYRASASTGRPYGRALVTNDDSDEPGWVVRSNRSPNPLSSNVVDFVLPASGAYVLLATTYRQASLGSAEVRVTSQPRQLSDAEILAKAKAYAWSSLDPGATTLVFASEAAAYQYTNTHPDIDWLAHDGETVAVAHFVAGKNDLWSQRFDVDKTTGAVTLTGEH